MPNYLPRLTFAALALLILPGCWSRFPGGGSMPGGSSPEEAEAPKPRVVTPLKGIQRHLFATPQIGNITDMAPISGRKAIAVAGTEGAGEWTTGGKPLRQIEIAEVQERVMLVPQKRGFSYLSRGSWTNTAVLFDNKGKKVWQAPAQVGVDDATAADFLGRGHAQVVVGYNGSGGIAMYDGKAKPVWKQPDGNVWHVESFKDPKSRQWRIVHTNAKGEITIRDKRGKILSRNTAQTYLAHFTLCHFPTAAGPTHLLSTNGGNFQLYDFKGHRVKTFDAPDDLDSELARALPVRLRPGAAPLIAILSMPEPLFGTPSELALYQADGKLLYREILPETCGSLTVLPAASRGGKETLLVGGVNHIWKY